MRTTTMWATAAVLAYASPAAGQEVNLRCVIGVTDISMGLDLDQKWPVRFSQFREGCYIADMAEWNDRRLRLSVRHKPDPQGCPQSLTTGRTVYHVAVDRITADFTLQLELLDADLKNPIRMQPSHGVCQKVDRLF